MTRPKRSYMNPDAMGSMYHCPPGWYGLLDEFCDLIERVQRHRDNPLMIDVWKDFKVVQVKEKFWRLVIYVEGVPEEHRAYVESLQTLTRVKSAHTCMYCGGPTEPQTQEARPFPGHTEPRLIELPVLCSDECNADYDAWRDELRKKWFSKRETQGPMTFKFRNG